MRMRGTIRKIADETGLDQATVRRALNEVGMSEAAAGHDFDHAVEIVKANADPVLIVGHAVNGRGEAANNGTTSTYADARARSESMRARKLELENQKAEGALISRAVVTATGEHIITTARTALLSLGYRLAEKVANKSDVREIARIVEAEVRDVLGSLADETKFFAVLDAEALS